MYPASERKTSFLSLIVFQIRIRERQRRGSISTLFSVLAASPPSRLRNPEPAAGSKSEC